MTPRREFLKQTAATGGMAVTPMEFSRATPRVPSGRVKSAILRDETIVRHGGTGDIFPLTWAADGRQFGSFSDGYGWSSAPTTSYNTQAMWVDGSPLHAIFQEMADYPALVQIDRRPAYYGFSALDVEDRLYHFLSCDQVPPAIGEGWGWNGVKLIYSTDRGHTWHNQNGSTPVVWEPYADRSRDTLLFFEEPQESFSLISLLQMGKGYEENRDGYVYGYGTNGNLDGLMNQLVMFRVPKRKILDRSAYEFYSGLIANQNARWVTNIQSREVVHTFPRGWVSTPYEKIQNVVQAWLPSVAYIAPLNLYLMVNVGVGCPSNGDWYGNSKPSYLGFWTASTPWGPWMQIYENTAWIPGGDSAARCYSPQIAPKWIAPDGKSLWLVWSDFKNTCDASESQRIQEQSTRINDPKQQVLLQMNSMHRCQPYYAFNAQRIDLVMGR